MKPSSVTITSSAMASTLIPLSRTSLPVETTYAVIKAGGGDLTYSVQYTLREVLTGYTSANADWFDATSARTASFSGSIAFPVNAVRLLTTVASGSATAQLWVLQGGD